MRYFFIIIFFLFVSTLVGHPHEYVDVKLNIGLDKSGLNKIFAKWIFDDMTSQIIIGDYDKNSNNILEDLEKVNIENDNFKSLKEYNLFASLEMDGKKIDTKEYSNFDCSVENYKIVFSFDINLASLESKMFNNLKFYFGEDTNYTAYFLNIEDVTIKNESLKEVDCSLEKVPFGYTMCDQLSITFK